MAAAWWHDVLEHQTDIYIAQIGVLTAEDVRRRFEALPFAFDGAALRSVIDCCTRLIQGDLDADDLAAHLQGEVWRFAILRLLLQPQPEPGDQAIEGAAFGFLLRRPGHASVPIQSVFCVRR